MSNKIYETSYEQPWDRDNIQWQRLLSWMHHRLGVEVSQESEDIIKVKQARFLGTCLYTQKELIKMGRDLYPSKKYKIVPVTFPFNADNVTSEWVRSEMKRWDIRPKDLVHHLGICASNISELINGNRPLSAPVSALFYYFFQVKRLGYELSQQATAEELAEALALVKAKKSGALGVDETP